MMNKFKNLFLLTLAFAAFALSATAQTVGEDTTAAASSSLTGINLPAGARRVKDASTPAEVADVLRKLVEQGGASVRQGEREVLLWGGDFGGSRGSQMIKTIENNLKTAGWQYERAAVENGVTFFVLLRENESAKQGAVGFFVPSAEAFVLAVTEMLPASPSVPTETSVEKTEYDETVETSKNTKAQIYGKWYRGEGSGFIDNTGKTRYKAGESYFFEFFPDGSVEFTKVTDVLSIVQCKIKGEDKARGKFSISGNALTINLDAMSSWETNSCDSSKNFKKNLPASSVSVQFEIKRMDSITRPDKPLTMCFRGKDDNETCYEFQPPQK